MKSDDKAVEHFERYRSKRGVEWPNPRYTVTMHKWNKVSTEKKSWPKRYNQVTWHREVTVETPGGETYSAVFKTYNSYFQYPYNGFRPQESEAWHPNQVFSWVKYDHPLWHSSWKTVWDDSYGTREGVTIAILQTTCEFIRTFENNEQLDNGEVSGEVNGMATE